MDNDVYQFTDKLKELLRKDGKISAVSAEFAKITDNSERIKILTNLLNEYKLLESYGKLKSPKNDMIAAACRDKGNKSYTNKEFIDAIVHYNQSLCLAESNAILALAYANRSAVCFEIQMYSACLTNIELSKQHDYPQDKLDKLNKRAETCQQLINEGAESDESQQMPVGKNHLKLSYPPHSKLPFIANCLELKSDDNFGRYIVANKRLVPGDVVCIESPFSTMLLPAHKFKHCLNCLSDNFMVLIPSELSTSAMFCSDECKRDAFDTFYKFEVDILDKLNLICTKILRIAVRTYFKSLKVCDGNLERLKAVISENESSPELTIFDVDNPHDSINILKSIDSLQTNEELRGNADHFQRSGIVAVIVDLFLKHTKLSELLATEDDRDFFRAFVYKQVQIAACNYHGIYNGVMKRSEIDSDPQIGSGSYPFCSLINHSCNPNIVRVTLDSKNYVVVNRVIEVGGQLFDNYGFHHCLEDLETRRTQLRAQYMFECACEACKKNFPLFPNLPFRDRKMSFEVDVHKLKEIDVEHAEKFFKKICTYLTKNASLCPCYEISAMQECLLRCFTIFRMSKLKLKLCAK